MFFDVFFFLSQFFVVFNNSSQRMTTVESNHNMVTESSLDHVEKEDVVMKDHEEIKPSTPATKVPEIPHITMNMTPLNVILERVALDTFKRLKEYFKFLESSTESEINKKKQLLELLVMFRENFVRLYVLCKWSRNNDQISKLIDLFVWLRDQNQEISNNIMSFGSIKSSLISAKMPEPDLLTSLEVLLTGRPNLPTYNFLEKPKLNPHFVLKVLRNLKVELSIKMSLQKNLPKQFHNYKIENGCVFFDVPNYFLCSLSILNNDKFHLIDFNLDFSLVNNDIIKSTEKVNQRTLSLIQKYSNNILNQDTNNDSLSKLYDLLYNYSLTTKIYLLHKQLINMRMGLWRGHLTHNYNAENSLITITYWAQRKYAKPSTIQIGLFDDDDKQKLNFKWFKDGILDDSYNLNSINNNNHNINLLKLINSIISLHIESIILNLKNSLINSVDDIERLISLSSNSDKLIFKISQSKKIIYGIDSLSGSCYFENPTNFMNRSAFKINTGNSLDFIEILKLKMLIQESEFTSMMNATGWVNLKSVKLSKDEILNLNIDYSKLKNKNLKLLLTSIDIYRRKDWPIGWSILVGNFGFQSNIQLWCSKIQSIDGQWVISWSNEIDLDEINNSSNIKEDTHKENVNSNLISDSIKNNENYISNNDNQRTFPISKFLMYDGLVKLIKISSSKLISNLIVKELTDQGCELKILNSNDKLVNDFLLYNFKIDDINLKSTDNAILLIKNKSLFHIQNARDSLILLITIKNSDLNAKIYGKLINTDNGVKNLPDINYSDENSTTFNYSSTSKIFKIESNVDLSHQFSPVINNSNGDNLNNKNDTLILLNILTFLKKVSKSLNLLKTVSSNSNLTIQKVSSNGITFKYGENEEEVITLRNSKNGEAKVNIELPENSPHSHCVPYLNEIISQDQMTNMNIKEIVLYLRLTLKFSKKFQDLCSRTSMELEKFNKQNEAVNYELKPDDLQNMPNYGYLPFICNLENLRIVYFKSIKIETQLSTGKKKNTKLISDIFKFEIKIELRHRSARISEKHSKFFISLGDVRTETTGKIGSLSSITNTSANGKTLTDLLNKLSNTLQKYFNGNNFPPDLNNGSIVFLKDGLSCGFEIVDKVLEDLHTRLYGIVNN